MSSEKSEYRRALRGKIASLDAAYIAASDAGICKNLCLLPEYQSARRVFIYYSIGREPDTQRIISYALGAGKRVYLPYSQPDGTMELRRFTGKDGLAADPCGIPSPGGGAEKAETVDIDFAVVPALAFDRAYFRIGYGGGYYDRFLKAYHGFSVGLARDALMVQTIPREIFDEPVACVVTEKEIARRKPRNFGNV